MLRDFVNIVGIACPEEFPIILPVTPHTQYIVEEDITIPDVKPDVEQVNTVMIEATITSSRVILTPVGIKIVIDGKLNQKVIYTALLPDQPVHSAHYEHPFCTFIDIPLLLTGFNSVLELLASIGLTLDTVLVGKPKVIVEDMTVQLLDKRTIHKCPVLFIWATVASALEPYLL